MKKKLITIVLGVMLCMSILGGCGQKETKQNNTATSNSGDQNKETTEEKELVGTIDEITCALASIRFELSGNSE